MDRTAFAAKARAKFFEDAIRLRERTPEPIRIIAIVRAMLVVLIEWNGIGNFVWAQVDLHRQFKLGECLHRRVVKIRNAARLELDSLDRAVAFQDEQIVIDEIEIDFKRVAAMRNGRGAEAARSEIQGDMP